jgi:transposase-like protein
MKTIRRKRTQRDYSLAFKIKVVSQVEKGELTYKQSQKRYGIQGRSTVLVWLRKFGTLDWTDPKLLFVEPEKTPEQRIKELEAALEEERQKLLLLNTMIDVAEKQYGLSIRKKSSPKQQRNSSKREN